MNEWNEPHNYIVDFRLKDTVFFFACLFSNYLRSTKYANQLNGDTERHAQKVRKAALCADIERPRTDNDTQNDKKQNMEFSVCAVVTYPCDVCS